MVRKIVDFSRDLIITLYLNKVGYFRIAKVSKKDADAHEKCAKAADTVAKHAVCVSQLLKAPEVKEDNGKRDMKELLSKLKPESIHRPVDASTASPTLPFKFEDEEEEEKVKEKVVVEDKVKKTVNMRNIPKTEYLKRKFKEGSILKFNPDAPKKFRSHYGPKSFEYRSRKKRVAVRSDDGFALKRSQKNMTPIGLIAKDLLKKVLDIKNKTEIVP